jgi:hypothetical protein
VGLIAFGLSALKKHAESGFVVSGPAAPQMSAGCEPIIGFLQVKPKIHFAVIRRKAPPLQMGLLYFAVTVSSSPNSQS